MIIRALCLSLVLLVVVPSALSSDEIRYGFGYEFALSIDEGEWSIRTTSQIKLGEVMSHDLGRYRVAMRLANVSGDELELTVMVTDLKGNLVVEGGILSENATVRLNSITEVVISNEIARFDAAISASRIGN